MTLKVPWTTWKASFIWMIFCTVIFIFSFQRLMQRDEKTPQSLFQHKYFAYNLDIKEPFDPDQFCKLPRLHPFEPSILGFLEAPKPIICSTRFPAFTYVDESGIIQFNTTAITNAGYDVFDLHCTYRHLIRKNNSDSTVTYGEDYPLSHNGTKITADFVSVSCYNFAGISFYNNIHFHISTKKTLSSFYTRPYNVIILGIDSLSRLSFIRNLPNTYDYLTNKLNAYVFRGMTKVGDNTFPNLVAILTGKTAGSNGLPPIHKDDFYDDWPFIWKNFSNKGYVTMFSEDRPDIALFNYLHKGFRHPPVDHYLRPYWIAMESSLIHKLSSSLCFGSVPKHELLLKYTRDFIKHYTGTSIPFFGFSFLTELSHDYMSHVNGADEDFAKWLQDLQESGVLDKTFLFFLSDHGHRFDAIRATLVGRIEERMPFFAIGVPESFKCIHKKIVLNLEKNIQRLTSPYDIYFTLLNILNFPETETSFDTENSSRGSSLFREISPNRTCLMAGIPEHYCTCEQEETLDISDPRSLNAADVLVQHINALLTTANDSSMNCAVLGLSEIKQADLIIPNKKVVTNARVYFGTLVEDGEAIGMVFKLRIIIVTRPSNGVFEATLVYRDGLMTVVGDVSRINKYGEQSWCVNEPVLKKFCYCKNQIEKMVHL